MLIEFQGLFTLSTVIVDYRGYRVIAQSIIPGKYLKLMHYLNIKPRYTVLPTIQPQTVIILPSRFSIKWQILGIQHIQYYMYGTLLLLFWSLAFSLIVSYCIPRSSISFPLFYHSLDLQLKVALYLKSHVKHLLVCQLLLLGRNESCLMQFSLSCRNTSARTGAVSCVWFCRLWKKHFKSWEILGAGKEL